MAWVKIDNNIIIQKQPYQEEGFVEAPDNVICGMIKEGDSFVNPPETLDNALGNLRFKRNSLLAKTDWTANSDVTMSDAMKTYRQQLRDATEGLDTVEKVQAYEFPTEVTK
tara:strand:- start:289 stop:621 length:333 start_codon:yes stop_codon:yes gene_type:complete